ncbi:MAG: paraquat-inducible protein A [Gammaproteobacteria bacterium]
MTGYSANSAAAQNLAACHTCGKLSGLELGHCPRCGSSLHLRTPNSLQKTLALLITACILFIPANVLPIMYTEQLGRVTASTIVGGVVTLWEHGSYPIALVIFIASVLIPLAKIIVMFWLCWSVSSHSQAEPAQRTLLYRITEFVGRWSMIDVFVVAILVALIQLAGLLVIRPGTAALAFAGVVMVTMVAAASFDSRLIWDAISHVEEDHD